MFFLLCKLLIECQKKNKILTIKKKRKEKKQKRRGEQKKHVNFYIKRK